jgi:hypothetical protein
MYQSKIDYPTPYCNDPYFDYEYWNIQYVDKSKQEKFNNIYHFYKKFNLEKIGFIKAELANQDEKMFLKIKKYTRSYPNEWTMSMLKDATLFHLKLFEKLYSLNLALKSSSLQNISFEHTKPIFLDLTTLSMRDEETLLPLSLNEGDLQQVVQKILLVTELFKQKKYQTVRQILEENRRFELRKKINIIFQKNPGIKKNWEEAIITHNNNLGTKNSFIEQCEYLYHLTNSINIFPENKIIPLYKNKNSEDFDLNNMSEWTEKQKNIYNLITNYSPKTLLDIGANVGCISCLAEGEGAKVISTDNNESAIDFLYLKAKKYNLKILPLAIPFTSISARLSCDMVLALGILDNLVFTDNIQLEYILKTLATATKKILILEFIYPIIKNQKLSSSEKNTYNIDYIAKTGLKYFQNIQIISSYPQTCKLLIFEK